MKICHISIFPFSPPLFYELLLYITLTVNWTENKIERKQNAKKTTTTKQFQIKTEQKIKENSIFYFTIYNYNYVNHLFYFRSIKSLRIILSDFFLLLLLFPQAKEEEEEEEYTQKKTHTYIVLCLTFYFSYSKYMILIKKKNPPLPCHSFISIFHWRKELIFLLQLHRICFLSILERMYIHIHTCLSYSQNAHAIIIGRHPNFSISHRLNKFSPTPLLA